MQNTGIAMLQRHPYISLDPQLEHCPPPHAKSIAPPTAANICNGLASNLGAAAPGNADRLAAAFCAADTPADVGLAVIPDGLELVTAARVDATPEDETAAAAVAVADAIVVPPAAVVLPQ